MQYAKRLNDIGWIVAFAALCVAWGHEAVVATGAPPNQRTRRLDLPHPVGAGPGYAGAWPMVAYPLAH